MTQVVGRWSWNLLRRTRIERLQRTDDAVTLVPGTRIGNDYVVERIIAQGGMGEIVLATRQSDGLPVAIKLLRMSMRGLPDAVARFRREAEMTSRIRGEHVVRVFGIEEDDRYGPVIVLEYLPGQTLEQVLKQQRRLALSEAGPIIEQVFEGLVEAHRLGIVHRDLKPSNVVLNPVEAPAGRKFQVKLIDFGTGKANRGYGESEVLTKVGQTIGTFAYMAPEQSSSPSSVDGRADLYACGVLIFRTLSGEFPYRANSLPQILQQKQTTRARRLGEVLARFGQTVSDSLDQFVASLLARNPDERPATAEVALAQWRRVALSDKRGEY